MACILLAGSETEKLIGGDGSDAKMDAANEFLGKPLLREDQVQNAVKFLSHPKVRSSPVVHRRSFLEKKGLTKEEIDEAFRRVPVRDLKYAYVYQLTMTLHFHLCHFFMTLALLFVVLMQKLDASCVFQDPPSNAATGEAYTTGPGNISSQQPFDINCFFLPRQWIVEILAYQAFVLCLIFVFQPNCLLFYPLLDS